METKKQIKAYLSGVKKSIGYIPSRYLVNAYGVKLKDFTNVSYAVYAVYEALKNKSIIKFS